MHIIKYLLKKTAHTQNKIKEKKKAIQVFLPKTPWCFFFSDNKIC